MLRLYNSFNLQAVVYDRSSGAKYRFDCLTASQCWMDGDGDPRYPPDLKLTLTATGLCTHNIGQKLLVNG